MNETTELTHVIFRIDHKQGGGVFAIFPREAETLNYYHCTTFDWRGGHSTGDVQYMMYNTKPATQMQYQELKEYLEQVYEYRFIVRRRTSYRDQAVRKAQVDKFLKGVGAT